MPVFTTAVLDFDGTLAATIESIYLCMGETLEGFGYPRPSLADVQRTVGVPLAAAIQTLTHGEDARLAEMLATYREVYYRKALPATHLFEGALDALVMLRSRGIRTILLSNRGPALHRLVDYLQIKDYLDVVLSTQDVPYPKPDARLYTECVARRVSPSGEVLVVGDSESDLLFARHAGLPSCWAAYGYGDPEKCRALAPTFVIDTISDLERVVAR
jgi:phosphoglycolate phosphatase